MGSFCSLKNKTGKVTCRDAKRCGRVIERTNGSITRCYHSTPHELNPSKGCLHSNCMGFTDALCERDM